MGKWCLHASLFIFDWIIIKVAGNKDRNKSSVEFDFRLNQTTHFGVVERGGSVVECGTPEREVRGSIPTAAVLCPWARHFTPRKYWLITQEAVAPSRHDWKIVDWDVKPQHKQTNHFGVTCPWVTKRSHFWTWMALKPVGQSWSNFMCSIEGWGKGCIRFWGRFTLGERSLSFFNPPLNSVALCRALHFYPPTKQCCIVESPSFLPSH